ncbi:hypothetical protein D3C81_1841080 [compost metagenome]
MRHDDDGQLLLAIGHGARMLRHEAAFPALQDARDGFHGDIAGRAFGVGDGAEHLPLGRGDQVAGIDFIEQHLAQGRTPRALRRHGWCHGDAETSRGVHWHAMISLCRRGGAGRRHR